MLGVLKLTGIKIYEFQIEVETLELMSLKIEVSKLISKSEEPHC